jgi:8-oxo-dGTP diphosphatase
MPARYAWPHVSRTMTWSLPTIRLVAELPLYDQAGNALVSFRFQDRLAAGALPTPVSLVVVVFRGEVLLVFDRWRKQWELPGGMREAGEDALRTAVRELGEETGIRTAGLDLVAVAEFDVRRPDRREHAAIYRVTLSEPPKLIVNDEISDFLWWNPLSAEPDLASPLDTEIARRLL